MNSNAETQTEEAVHKAFPSEKTLAANLVTLMNRKGVKVAKLAADLGLEKERVQRWLKAVCYPNMACIVAICDYFEYRDIYSLLTEKID